jgi:hypothetical protein
MEHVRRFRLDEQRRVIDDANHSNSGKAYCFEGDPEHDEALRGRVLWVRLNELVKDLIHNDRPAEWCSFAKEWYQPHNSEAHSLSWVLWSVICASELNTQPSEPQNRAEESASDDPGIQAITSLRLFSRDLEFLLRDLYGGQNIGPLERTLSACRTLSEEFTRYAPTNLVARTKRRRGSRLRVRHWRARWLWHQRKRVESWHDCSLSPQGALSRGRGKPFSIRAVHAAIRKVVLRELAVCDRT